MLYQKINNTHFLALPLGYSLALTFQRRQYKYNGRFYIVPLIRLLNKTRTQRLITFLSW